MPTGRATRTGIRRPRVVAVAWMMVLVVSLAACASGGHPASKSNETATSLVRGTVLVSRALSAKTGGTVRAREGVAFTVPAHVMTRNGTARILQIGQGVYDLQILVPWNGWVTVTIPLHGRGDEVMHELGGYWVPESSHPNQATVDVDHLSPFTDLFSHVLSKIAGTLCIEPTVHLFLDCLLQKGVSEINSALAHWLLGKLSSSCAGALFVDGVGGGPVDIFIGALNEPACTGTAGGPGYTYPPSPPSSHSPTAAAGGGSAPSGGGGSGSGPGGSVSLAQGPAAPAGYRYAVTLSGFPSGDPVSVECYDSVSPQGFYNFNLTTNASGSAFTEDQCYSSDGPEHWVTANDIKSNEVAWSSAPPPSATLDADATPAFGSCPSNPPPANEVYCGGWSNACNTASFSQSNCPTYVSQGTIVNPICWTTGQMINNSYSAVSPGPNYTLQSDIWVEVSNYPSGPWMNELWFNPDNTASNNLPQC